MKKKTIVHLSWMSIFEKLSDEEAGRLIKHFFRFINGLSPDPPDRLTDVAFEPIKQILLTENKRYDVICERNKTNGSLGGRPPINGGKVKEVEKTQSVNNKPSRLKRTKSLTSDEEINDINESVNFKIPTIESVIAYCNQSETLLPGDFYFYLFDDMYKWCDEGKVFDWKKKILELEDDPEVTDYYLKWKNNKIKKS